MRIRINSTNTYTGEFTGWESSWSVVFQGYGQFKIWRILTKIRSQSCVFIWCYSLLIYFTFQLQQGQNSTTSEKGAQSKQNDQLLISPWKFLGCRSIMFWPNHFFYLPDNIDYQMFSQKRLCFQWRWVNYFLDDTF